MKKGIVIIALLGLGAYLAWTGVQLYGENVPAYEVIATDLDVPWDVTVLPVGVMFVTERDTGRIIDISRGRVVPVIGRGARTDTVQRLGIALHPDFEENQFIYVYEAVKTDDGMESQVNRYTYRNGEMVFDRPIMRGVPGSSFTGGRIEFGPPASCESGQVDCYLWTTTYPINEVEGQNPHSLSGSILRYNDDGSIPADNPFGNAVYSYGHRNVQGLTWDGEGRLWATEHGPSTVPGETGLDEINLILKGKNYGWPVITGEETREGMTAPVVHSGPDVTWAPASATYWDGSIFFGGLYGEAIFEAVLEGEEVVEVKRHFSETFGRIRTVLLGSDGMFYVTTSNTDGKQEPGSGDDKIIRIDPEQAFR